MGALTRAVRNISRRKMRAILVIIALGFSMAIMISIPAGIVANQTASENLTANFSTTLSNMQEEINKTSTLIECSTSSYEQGNFSGGGFPQGGFQGGPGFMREQTFVNETIADEISSIANVKDVVPFLEESSNETTPETMETPRGSFTINRPLYTITGVCLNSSLIEDYSILPTNITAGRPLQDGDTGVVLLSQNLTDYYGLVVGDEINVYGETFTVVGIYEPATQTQTLGQGNREAYMNITDAQRITDNTGNASRLDIYADDVSNVDQIATVIETAYSELSVTTYEDRLSRLQNMQEMYQTTLTNAESTISQTQSVAFQEIIVVVIATSLIVLFTMLYTVRERTKEIGILKAIGFSNWNVMSQFVLEGIIISLIAALVGVAIGFVGAPFLSSILLPSANPFPTQQQQGFGGRQTVNFGAALSQSVAAAPDLQTMLIVIGASILLGAIGSLYPAWRASRTSPMEALKYE